MEKTNIIKKNLEGKVLTYFARGYSRSPERALITKIDRNYLYCKNFKSGWMQMFCLNNNVLDDLAREGNARDTGFCYFLNAIIAGYKILKVQRIKTPF